MGSRPGVVAIDKDWGRAVCPSLRGLGRRPLGCDPRRGQDQTRTSDDVGSRQVVGAKGAGSDSAGRELAVVPYRTVSAQAVENLRHLDAKLAVGTMGGAGIPQGLSLHAWQEGQPVAREAIARLDALGANFRRRVVILQPHVRRDLLEEVRSVGVTAHSSRGCAS